MSETNLVDAALGVPGAVHPAAVPPFVTLLCEHVYGWVADTVPFESAVDLEPRTRAAERTLGDHGSVVRAELTRDGVRSELPDDCADVVVWAAPTPGPDAVPTVLAEAARLCRPAGAVVCLLPVWAAEQAAEIAGLREHANHDLRPLIGAAIGDAALDGHASDVGGDASYRVLLLGAAGSWAPSGAATATVRDGARALRVELAALTALETPAPPKTSGAASIGEERLTVEQRAELLERVARAERDSSEQHLRAGDLTKRLEEIEVQNSELRAGLEIAEANAALLEPAQAAVRDAEHLRAELELHKQWLADIQGSLSWRITRPLRGGKRVFRR